MSDPQWGKRQPFECDVQDYAAAIACLNEQLSRGRYLEALDVCEQLVAAWPGRAHALLRAAYDIFQTLPDPHSRYHQYQSRLINFGILPGQKVLDIGSGNIPFPLATHLADIALEDNAYGRGGAPFQRVGDKPVTQCDIENMPFADKAFDFIYCSHVLEHVRYPEKACRELIRVGKRGYIETPTPGKDLFFDYAKVSNHRWGVDLFDSTLVFSEYTPEQIEGLGCNLLNHFLEDPQTDREKAFAALMLLKADRINTMLLWDGNFDFEVRRLHAESTDRTPRTVVPAAGPQENDVAVTSAENQGRETIAAVIPTFNRVDTLGRAIRSVQMQTRPVDEVLIVDDGSTDDTEALVRQVIAQDRRVQYIQLSHGGAQRARNAGIQAARSRWIAFLDSDDEWLPGRIRLGLQAARLRQASVVHSEGVKYENGQALILGRSSLQGQVYAELLAKCGPTFPGLLVCKECFDKAGLLDERLVSWQEWDALLRLARHYELAYVPEPCFVWHRHEKDTISADKSRDALGYCQVVEAYKDEILRVLGPTGLLEHYRILLGKFRRAGDVERYRQVRRAIAVYADPCEVEERSWMPQALNPSIPVA